LAHSAFTRKGFIVSGLRGDTHADGIPLLVQDILVNPFLALKMLPNIPVHVACGGTGIGTSGAVQKVMQRLIKEPRKERYQLLIHEMKANNLLSAELFQARDERIDHGITFPMGDIVELRDLHDRFPCIGISTGGPRTFR
jgi:hypothetical protein